MFVEYSTEVGIAEATAVELLSAHSADMEGLGAAAYRHGESLRSKVGPGPLLAKEVIISLGEPIITRHGTSIPVRWRATGAEALFPRLDGELAIGSRAEGGATITLRATYQPPLGTIGGLVDRLLLARIARATVEDWVARIVAWLDHAAAGSSDRECHLDDGTRARD